MSSELAATQLKTELTEIHHKALQYFQHESQVVKNFGGEEKLDGMFPTGIPVVAR